MENLKKPKKEFFLRNGEVLKRKQIEFWGERAFPIRIFSAEELRKSIQIVDDYQMGKGCIDGRSFTVDLSKRIRVPDLLICEIAIQANISHRNVLRILGCCLETQYPVPIYESISGDGRTLSDHLRLCQYNAEQFRWSDRMRIAAEVADALNYLHTHSSMPIIHRGVGPENIVLDDRLTAKLTGFQWSFAMPTVRREDAETSVRLAIEKRDVYGLGIVMLLLLSGKTSQSLSCDVPRHSTVEILPLDSRVETFASDLQAFCYFGIGFREQIQAFLICEGKTEQVKAFCEVALNCMGKLKESQPTMEQVVQALKKIRNM